METNEIKARIAKVTEEATRILEAHDKAKAEGKEYGYNGLPHVFDKMREYGIDKIFYVSRCYRSHWDDDYCTFTYWNEVTKEFFTDEWATAFAAPHFDLYETVIRFDDAMADGLVDMDGYLAYHKKEALQYLEANAEDKFHRLGWKAKEGLRVKVERGRKWKGVGYLVGTKESSYRFATPMFRNHSEDFGVTTSVTAIVFDPEANALRECNAEYIQFVDREEFVRQYKEWAKAIINGATELCFVYDIEGFLSKWKEEHPMPDTADASHPEQEARDKAEADFKEKKMAELVVWVTENTDKKGDDIKKLAEHIFNKRYARRR